MLKERKKKRFSKLQNQFKEIKEIKINSKKSIQKEIKIKFIKID